MTTEEEIAILKENLISSYKHAAKLERKLEAARWRVNYWRKKCMEMEAE